MQKYMCKNCGAELYWDPQANALKCEYCDFEYQPSDFEDDTLKKDADKKVEEADKEYTNAQDISEDMVVYKCNNCGAEVVTSKTTMATICAYCGRALSITSKTAGNFRPELVVPFKINKDKAKEAYLKYLGSSKLTPKKFKEENTIEKMQGVYVTFWLHSANVRGNTVVKQDTVVSSRRGYDKVDTIREYEVRIDAEASYEYVPTDASKKMDNDLMDYLEPFDYKNLQAFNPAFMAGFFAEQPDEEKEDTIDRAQNKMTKSMDDLAIKVAKDTRGANYIGNISNTSIFDHNYNFNRSEINYGMLPIWLLNVDWNAKKFLYAINGNTGKVVGKLPMSVSKLLGIAAGVLFGVPAIFGVIYAIFGML